MNKSEVVYELAGFTGSTQVDAKFFVEGLMDVIGAALLSGEDVSLPGVGKLKVSHRPARNGRNPKTGEAIVIPAKNVVKFRPSSKFAEYLAADVVIEDDAAPEGEAVTEVVA